MKEMRTPLLCALLVSVSSVLCACKDVAVKRERGRPPVARKRLAPADARPVQAMRGRRVDVPTPVIAATKKAARLSSVLLRKVPHIRQKPDFCGEACAAMFLRKLGHAVGQDDVFDRMGVDPALGRGAISVDMARGLKKIGFAIGPVWFHIEPRRAQAQMQALWRKIHADLRRGVPSILCMHYDESPQTTEHFRLILGYDHKTDEIIYHEPSEDKGAYRRLKRQKMFRLWPLKYEKQRWLLIRFRLKPKRIQIRRSKAPWTNATLAQHIMKLKKRLPKGFSFVIEHPFVVIGDGPPARVKARARHTVRWAVRHLQRLYFKKIPRKILDIWLFKDRTSYQTYTYKLFGDRPDTPYGYYSSTHKALIMNIATGGGTLVHEIVHPFMEANFADTPDWFNEGLGSLYEQSAERNGRIVGLTNWRLAGLQKAIRQKSLPPFAKMMKATNNDFYNRDPGTNYAQARYLCYYLQQKGLLVKYYHSFHKNRRKDPSGTKTLQRILKTENLKAFQTRWETWVMKLRFP